MERNATLAAVLAATFLVGPLTARAEDPKLWSYHRTEMFFSYVPNTVTVHEGVYDLAVGGLTPNKKGGKANFTDVYGIGPTPKDTNLSDWIVQRCGPVPAAGWFYESSFALRGDKLAGKTVLRDEAANTVTSASAEWRRQFRVLGDSETWVSTWDHIADASLIDPSKGFGGNVRAATFAGEIMIFEVKKRAPVVITVDMTRRFLGALTGAERFSEQTAFGAFGSGVIVGQEIIEGSMGHEGIAIFDERRALPSNNLLSVAKTLDPGFYWFAYGAKGALGAVPEPTTLLILGPAAAALVARRMRPRS